MPLHAAHGGPNISVMRAPLCLMAALALAPSLPAAAQPAPQTPAARKAELDRLFAALAIAPDETAGHAVAMRIRAAWLQQASPAVTLLIRRGQRNLEAEAAEDAVEDFDAALTLQPDFADAWLMRAAALSAAGDTGGAARDVQQVLVLEPRQFDALALLSRLQEQAGDLPGALRAWEAVLKIHPRIQGGAARLRELRGKAEGQPT
jgi:tetratricopeptide (TPR) repeat protein